MFKVDCAIREVGIFFSAIQYRLEQKVLPWKKKTLQMFTIQLKELWKSQSPSCHCSFLNVQVSNTHLGEEDEEKNRYLNCPT